MLRQYEATIVQDGWERDVLVLAAEAGMALLYAHNVFLHVVDGGRVIVQAASS